MNILISLFGFGFDRNKCSSINWCFRSTNADAPIVAKEQDVEGAHGEATAANARRHQQRHGRHHGLARRAARALPGRPGAPARAQSGHTASTRCGGKPLWTLLPWVRNIFSSTPEPTLYDGLRRAVSMRRWSAAPRTRNSRSYPEQLIAFFNLLILWVKVL